MKIPITPVLFLAAFAVFPPDILRGDPSKMLMPFLGLFMAGIFPAISLTIGSLKSGGFSVQRVTKLANELENLLKYLQAVFATALIAALTLVTAEALDWGDDFRLQFYTSRVFNVVEGLCLGVLVAALPRIRRTFSALLGIARDIAVDEAATKVKDRAAKIPSIVDRFPTKEKFGELFEARPIDEREPH